MDMKFQVLRRNTVGQFKSHRQIRDAQILITGEGRTDEQTSGGKLCSVLAARARAAGARTILISGALGGDLGKLDAHFDAAFACIPAVMSVEDAMARGRETLHATASNVGRLLAMGRG